MNHTIIARKSLTKTKKITIPYINKKKETKENKITVDQKEQTKENQREREEKKLYVYNTLVGICRTVSVLIDE